jgi:tellurite resistance protein TehA-like permease
MLGAGWRPRGPGPAYDVALTDWRRRHSHTRHRLVKDYDTRRWATVFPLGIYAAASIETGQVRSITWFTDFGHAWTWVGFAAWPLALAGLLYHGLLLLAHATKHGRAGSR